MKNALDYIEKIHNADYTALYLTKTKKILKDNKANHNTTLRFTHFHKDGIYVCGIKHTIDILNSIPGKKNFKVYGVNDGDFVECGEPILIIEGDYKQVCEYESAIDGILARESAVCSNCKKILTLLQPKELIYMADRADLYLTQPYDGYAAWVAGIRIFTTKAQTELIPTLKNVKVVGTMPHALIQQYNGDLNKALRAYHKSYPKEKLSALVDYHNNVVSEINFLDEGIIPYLKSIRIDTSKSLLDKSLKLKKDSGVSKALVINARKALDKNGMKNVKIVVSSGFDYDKIRNFIVHKVPVDYYGVGGSLVKVDTNITCDLVMLDGKPQAKVGRKLGSIDKSEYKKYI